MTNEEIKQDGDTKKIYTHHCEGLHMYREGGKVPAHDYQSYDPLPTDEICPQHIATLERYIRKHYPTLLKKKPNLNQINDL